MSDARHEILLSRDTIAQRVRELGSRIGKDFQGRELCVVPVMDGGFIFAADLIREIDLPLTVAPIKASSYGDATTSSGTVRLPWGMPEGISGKDLLLVDDILDTGQTLESLRSRLTEAGALSVRSCVLLRKESAGDLHSDYVGFEIRDKFVIGYGLDLAGRHRNLPDIRVMQGR